MISQRNLIQIIAWFANIPAQQICPSTNLKDDLNLDSIDFLDLIVRLERTLNIAFTTDEIENIETVHDLNKYIHHRNLVPAVASN